MANLNSIGAVGTSLERLLNQAFAEPPVPVTGSQTRAVLVRTEDFNQTGAGSNIQIPALSIFLYRVDFNKTMRAAWAGVSYQDGQSHLPLDLHFLISPWGPNAEAEHRILGRAMQCLDETPILSGPLLHESGGWATHEAISLVMDEISTEAVMRTFDSLPTDYRISVPYIARVVRLDGRRTRPQPNVTTLVTGKVPSP